MSENGNMVDQSGEETDLLKNKIATLKKENRELKDSLGAVYEEGRESEKIYRTLVDLSFEAYFVQVDEKIVFINAIGLELFGFSNTEDAIGKKILNYIHPDYQEIVVKRQRECIEKGAPAELIEIKVIRPDSEIVDIEVAAAPFVYNGKKAVLVVSKNISERKQAEEELIAAKDQAESATKLKDKFVSLVAHDLRSPFTSIVGLLQIMYDDTSDPLSDGHRELMGHVLDSSAQQIHMIEELLNISRLQTGNIIPRKKFIDGALSAAWVVGNLGYLAKKKGIVIENKIPEETRLYADFDLFNEVLQNLLSNAIKFCREGDVITLLSPPGQSTTIEVKDTGPGIDGDFLPKLFRPEERSSSVGSAGEKGTGLGLPYCHDIMVAHGGTLTVETAIGEGTRFYAKLPYAKPKILIVDDQEEATYVIKKYLEVLDVEFLEAGNGKEALKIIDENQPHIIISDIDMPIINGFELIENIRAKHDQQSMPIIIITGTHTMETKDKALRLGANDFTVKPLMAEEFLPRVKRF